MDLPDIRLLQAAIALAEELHFTRAGERLRIDQSMVSKRITALEAQLGIQLFERDHQRVEVTDAGRTFVEEARAAVAQIERAVFSARAVSNGTDEVLHIGRSAYTDPWLVSLVRAVRLPLHPGLRISWSSNYSHEVAREVMAGTLDLALTTGVPETPKLTFLKLADHPFYVAMSRTDSLVARREIRLSDTHKRNWVLFARQVSPHLYELLQHEAARAGVGSFELHHVMSADEAVPLILEHGGVAVLTRTGAWRIARDGITMRPLAEQSLRVVTHLAARADSKSRLVNEFVKATARKLENLRKPAQARLPLSA
jgi:DNA-binding transcriptional LysR family regulator